MRSNNKVTVYAAAIVKGLMEYGDPYMHFASLLKFPLYVSEAKLKGLIEESEAFPYFQVTEKGKVFYHKNGFDELPHGKRSFPHLWQNVPEGGYEL